MDKNSAKWAHPMHPLRSLSARAIRALRALLTVVCWHPVLSAGPLVITPDAVDAALSGG